MQEQETMASEAKLNVKYSAIAFVLGLLPVPFSIENYLYWKFHLILCLVASIVCGKLMFPDRFDVFWRAVIIGIGASFGILLVLTPENEIFRPFGAYFAILSFFHYFEYVVTGLTNPSNLNTDSFLLNHSLQYWIAAIASWIEFFVEFYFLPEGFKSVSSLVLFGVLICIVGDVLRKMAMFHAGKFFYCQLLLKGSCRNNFVL